MIHKIQYLEEFTFLKLVLTTAVRASHRCLLFLNCENCKLICSFIFSSAINDNILLHCSVVFKKSCSERSELNSSFIMEIERLIYKLFKIVIELFFKV